MPLPNSGRMAVSIEKPLNVNIKFACKPGPNPVLVMPVFHVLPAHLAVEIKGVDHNTCCKNGFKAVLAITRSGVYVICVKMTK